MRRIDLHVHSNASDGSCTPSELVRYAVEKDLAAMALTDHDTVSGVGEAVRAAEGTGLTLIPGVELSVEYQIEENKKDIHLLGLFLDYQSKELLSYLKRFKEARDRRNERMAESLTDHGMPVTMEELGKEYADAILTRAHFARFLVKKGYASDFREAFERFLGDGKPCYIPKERIILPGEAIELIHQARGLAVLAHPLLYHLGKEELRNLVGFLKERGLDGLEAVYSMNNGQDEREMRALARAYGLLATGGSDYHGAVKPHIDLGTGRGKLFVPEELLAGLYHALEKERETMEVENGKENRYS